MPDSLAGFGQHAHAVQGFFNAPDADGSGKRHRLAFVDWENENALNTAVCVHGLTRNARDFDALAASLSGRKHRVMALDMAGRGKSDWLENTQLYSYPAYLADCVAFLDNFHLRGVDWIGTSMGGIIGMMIAAEYPGRIRRLVLNDIGSFIPKAGLQRIMQYAGVAVKFATQEEAMTYLRDIFAPFGITQEEHWQHLATHSIMEKDGAFVLAYDPRIMDPVRQTGQEATDVDLSGLWKKIDIPVLILRGEHSDILTRETVSAMRNSNVRAIAREIPNTGHAPALLDSEQVKIVSDWLSSPGGAIGAIGI